MRMGLRALATCHDVSQTFRDGIRAAGSNAKLGLEGLGNVAGRCSAVRQGLSCSGSFRARSGSLSRKLPLWRDMPGTTEVCFLPIFPLFTRNTNHKR